MSTTPTTQEAPSKLLLEDITILDSNPRGDVDTSTEAFAEIVASIERSGIVQPLLVGQPIDTPNGRQWPLIAGHRRYAAATKIGLSEAPVMQADYGGDDLRARIAAIAENVVRLDLSPLQEARALKDLQKTGLTQLEAAEALGKSERWARERERLLKLPTKTAEAFDEGVLAGPAAIDLEKIAEQAPRMADLVAASMRGAAEEKGPQLAGKGSVMTQVDHLVRRLDPEPDGSSPVGCFVDADEPISYDDAVAAGIPHGKLREWKQRFAAVTKLISTPAVHRHEGVPPQLLESDLDEARAFGALLELEGPNRWGDLTTKRYITDHKWLADRIPEALDRAEKERKKLVEQKTRSSTGSAAGPAEPRQGVTKEQRVARAKLREQEVERKEESKAANLELGQRVGKAYEAPALTLDEAKALAALALSGAGIYKVAGANAYAYRGFQEDDPKHEGETLYAGGSEVAEKIQDAVEAAKSPEQIWGIVLGALVIAAHTDPSVDRLESREQKWDIPGDGREWDTPEGKIAERLRASAAARKVLPDAVLKRRRREDKEAKAEAKRAGDQVLGSVLEAISRGKKGKTAGQISPMTYDGKGTFHKYSHPTEAQKILDRAQARKEVSRSGDKGSPKATYTLTAIGKEKLAKLTEAEKAALAAEGN